MENSSVQIQAHCPKAAREAERRLRRSGLRPTRQRMSLASLIFQSGDRHLTAEDFHQLTPIFPTIIIFISKMKTA